MCKYNIKLKKDEIFHEIDDEWLATNDILFINAIYVDENTIKHSIVQKYKTTVNNFEHISFLNMWFKRDTTLNMLVICNACEYIWLTQASHVHKRKKCPRCERQDKRTNWYYINSIKKQLINATILGYVETKTISITKNKIVYLCNNCNNINIQYYNHILYFKNKCRTCWGLSRQIDILARINEIKELHSEVIEIFYISPIHEYSSNSTATLKVRCKICDKITHAYISKLSSYNRLPGTSHPGIKCDCNDSSYVATIKNFLKQHNISYETEKIFDNLRSPKTNRVLRYDFYIPSYNMLLEVHGKQHYEFVPSWHKTIEKFKYNQSLDTIKKEYAIKNMYNFVELAYSQFDENIQTLLYKLFLDC